MPATAPVHGHRPLAPPSARLAASVRSRTAWSEYGSLIAFGEVFTLPAATCGSGAAPTPPGVTDGEPAGGEATGAPAPGLDSVGEPADRSGAVVTPGAPGNAVTPGATSGVAGRVSPGAASRSTWPTRMTLTFSMLFLAASSR